MSKAKKEKAAPKADFLEEEAIEQEKQAGEYIQNIPEDEIWTFQIEGLQAPHINKPFKNAKRNKVLVVIALVVAIGIAIYFSVRAVHSELYSYTQLDDGTYRLDRFSNDGRIENNDLVIDYVVDLETGEKDPTKVISEIASFAFNCDEKIQSITLGKDVKAFTGQSIYSCWNIQNVFIDKDNPYFCDIDGVVYNKDQTELVFYPTDHDRHLRLTNGYAHMDYYSCSNTSCTVKYCPDDYTEAQIKELEQSFTKDKNGNILCEECRKNNRSGYLYANVQHSELIEDYKNPLDNKVTPREMEELWGTTNRYNEAFYQDYNRKTRTYVIPSTVTKIGELALAYSNIVDLYIPEGVTVMDHMAIFKNTVLVNIYSYKTEKGVSDTTYKGIDNMSEIYASLPEGLEFIGSDCMYYCRGINYLYIPESVNTIKHHAFWDSCLKDGDKLTGIGEINVAASEDAFDANVTTGDQWRPQYDFMLFKKSVDVNYDAERKSQTAYNVHRQYYWAVQWVVNNGNADKSSYLVKDLNGDGMPELVLREYDDAAQQTADTVLTFSYGYLDAYAGAKNYTDAEFSALTDETQLNAVLESELTAVNHNASEPGATDKAN